jgi:SAM-dependent methyltransferase
LFNVPAESSAYDVVLSVSVLEHVPHKQYALREALRLLRPGGKLFMSFDFTLDAKSNEDRLRVEIFTPERLCAALANVGISHDVPSPKQVEASAARVQQDAVAGIPVGMTVGSLVIARMS